MDVIQDVWFAMLHVCKKEIKNAGATFSKYMCIILLCYLWTIIDFNPYNIIAGIIGTNGKQSVIQLTKNT